MGDDGDAPHTRMFSFPDSMPVLEVIAGILATGYLAQIQGDKATWSVVSGFPIAVTAQQWPEPRSVPWQGVPPSDLKFEHGIVQIHFNYHAQVDPEIVLEVLKRLKLQSR